MAKLTDQSALAAIALDDLLHVVDASDTTSSPQGTSKQASFSTLIAGLRKNATFTSADLAAGVLTVSHGLLYQDVHVSVYNNSNKQVSPDDVTIINATTVAIDLSSWGTLTGTWRYVISL